MSHSYSSNRIHLIFSTKDRKPRIPDDFQPKLWAYMAGIAKNQGFDAISIGGVCDHVHALLILPPSMPLAKAVQYIKGSSSKWINETVGAFSWQEGYGAFSVSASQTADVVRYIQNQRAHHAKRRLQRSLWNSCKSMAYLTSRRTCSDSAAIPPGLCSYISRSPSAEALG